VKDVVWYICIIPFSVWWYKLVNDMKYFLFFACLICLKLIVAQDSISVLFIGNSYVQSNNLPLLVQNLATSLGDNVTTDSKVNGGFTFLNHTNDVVTQQKIDALPWDFVVLQGQSQEPSFPTSQVNTSTLPAAIRLADSVYASNFCSQVVYFMTWGRENGDPQWDSIQTFDKMNGRLRQAYMRIRDSAQASVAPVGVAWKFVRDMYPTIQLYVSDGSHPSLAGSYLSACTFYASLFRKSPVGASFTAGLDPLVAEILQQAASLVVLDSLDNWKLRSKDKIAIAQFTAEINGSSVQLLNSSWRSTSFSWDFGDGNQSFLEHPVHTFGLAGNYQVHLQALNECGQDSHSELLQIETVNNLDTENQRPRITWNGSGRYTIVGLEMDVILWMHVFDSAGKKLPSNVIEQHAEETRIDITSYPPGIYFLRYSNAIETDAIKLIHF
jgi:hypothetical protein